MSGMSWRSSKFNLIHLKCSDVASAYSYRLFWGTQTLTTDFHPFIKSGHQTGDKHPLIWALRGAGSVSVGSNVVMHAPCKRKWATAVLKKLLILRQSGLIFLLSLSIFFFSFLVINGLKSVQFSPMQNIFTLFWYRWMLLNYLIPKWCRCYISLCHYYQKTPTYTYHNSPAQRH